MHSSEACVELQLKRKNRKSIQIVWPWPLTTDCFRYKRHVIRKEWHLSIKMLVVCFLRNFIDCVVVNIFIFMMYENAIWKSINVPWHELLNASCTLISTDCGNKWKYNCICHTKHYTVILCQKYASVCGITCWHPRQHKMKILEQHPLFTVSNIICIIFMHLPLYKWGETHSAVQLALKFDSQSPLIDFD